MRMLRLSIDWRPESLSLFLFEKTKDLRFQRFEGPEADWPVQVKAFLGNDRPDETLLVIPRSEVLQKEMAAGGSRQELETRLTQLLPYSPKEMAYSLAVNASRGLLYAIPEQRVSAILASLKKTGLRVDEIISEDQGVFWWSHGKTGEGPVVILDRSADRALAVVLRKDAILFSRTYPPKEEAKEMLSEIAFCLLESGLKPAQAVASAQEDREAMAQVFEVPVQLAETRVLGASAPLALLGSRRWGEFPAISLLPSTLKMERARRKGKRSTQEALAALGALILCSFLLAAGHVFFLQGKKFLLEKEVAKTTPVVAEARRMADSLAAAHEAAASKQKLLSFLRTLAQQVPSGVRLKELQVEGRSVVLQGESPSHALLTQVLQVFEKMEGMEEAKLDHARLRKRLNQDFFDFEVTARWKY